MPGSRGQLIALAVSCGLGAPLGAQVQERQRPFDAAGGVLVLTPQLAARLGVDTLLPTTPAYRLVRLYQRADSTYVLEFVHATADLEQRTRYDVPADLVARLRGAVSQRRVTAQTERRFQDGRASLIRSSVALGLGFYGWAVPEIFDANDARTGGSLYFLTSSASFFIPFVASRNSDVSRSTASLYWYGATRGIGVGLLTSDLADPNASARTNLTYAFGASVLGSTAGVLYARGDRLSRAEAAAATIFGDLGAAAGVAGAFATGLYGDAAASRRGGHVAVLSGLGAGLALGPAIARREAYGEGDPQVVMHSALLGMGVATTALLATNAEDDKVVGATILGGEVVGALAGNAFARGVSLTEGQGNITGLATLGGWLLGAGLVYVVAGADADPAAYVGAGTAGGTGAMLLVLNSYRDGTRTGSRRGGPTLAVGPGFLQLRF